MNETIQFDYYYGIEAEQFSFYRVPWLLIKDERFKGLSSDAKLLYVGQVYYGIVYALSGCKKRSCHAWDEDRRLYGKRVWHGKTKKSERCFVSSTDI